MVAFEELAIAAVNGMVVSFFLPGACLTITQVCWELSFNGCASMVFPKDFHELASGEMA